MRIARRFAVVAAMLTVSIMATNAFALDFVETDAPVDNAVHLIYNPADGSASVLANGLDGVTTTSLKSAGGNFNPDANTIEIAPFPDQNTTSSFFKLSAPPSSLQEIVFTAGWLPSGLSADEVIADVSYSGSLDPSGAWADAAGGGPYLLVVPEPSSMILVFCGLLGLLGLRRK